MTNTLKLGLCSFLSIIATVCCGQQAVTVPAPTPYGVVGRAENERVWQRTTYELSPSGQVVPHLQGYREVANGLCYIGPNQQWLDSQELITILPDGSAAATNGPSQVYFPIDIANASIRVVYGGVSLDSEPIGLTFASGETNAVLIAELTNSVGELISSNEVLYRAHLSF